MGANADMNKADDCSETSLHWAGPGASRNAHAICLAVRCLSLSHSHAMAAINTATSTTSTSPRASFPFPSGGAACRCCVEELPWIGAGTYPLGQRQHHQPDPYRRQVRLKDDEGEKSPTKACITPLMKPA